MSVIFFIEHSGTLGAFPEQYWDSNTSLGLTYTPGNISCHLKPV